MENPQLLPTAPFACLLSVRRWTCNVNELCCCSSKEACSLTAILLMALISSAFAMDGCLRYEDLHTATEEMRNADYFTFVTLMNMVQEKLPANVTFLMPHDRMLSMAMVPNDGVLDFLLRHSIPSPLLFDDLEHIPTGSIIPTCKPGFVLGISNNGRRSFYLNNVQLVSPNICMEVSSIRCHGINEVLWTTAPHINKTISSMNCSSSPLIVPPPESPPVLPAPSDHTPAVTSPPPADVDPRPQKSDSTNLLHRRPLSVFASCLMILLIELAYKA